MLSPDRDPIPLPVPPWRSPEFLPSAPPDGYGYLSEHGRQFTTLEELRAAVGRGSEERIHFVWVPGTGRCQPTAEVPEVFEALRGVQLARAQEVLRTKLTWAAVSGVVVYLLGERMLGIPLSWLAMLWGAFFLLPMVDALVRRREWERATPADAASMGETSRFIHWLSWRRPTRTTHVIIGVLVVTWLLSEAHGLNRAIEDYAMDKAGVRSGAWWKPLTCFFLHGGIVHLVFNSMALSRLGQWVEGLTQAAWVPLILLLSTLGGSLAGYVLPPDVPSVGASGGVLGLLGFLLAYSRHPVRLIPHGFARLLWQWIAYVVLLGLIGWKVIDNAAHLGGLLAGACLGAAANFLLPPTAPPIRSAWVEVVGWSAAAVLAAAAGRMIWDFWPA